MQLSCAFLLLLVVAAGGNFVVEQPSSSLLFRHERMIWLATRVRVHLVKIPVWDSSHVSSTHFVFIPLMQVYRISIWMGRYKAATPKPTLLWSSTHAITGFWSHRKFGMKQFKQKRGQPKLKPTKQYVDKQGQRKWQGTADLTKTGMLNLTFMLMLYLQSN